MKIVDWCKSKIDGYLHPEADRSYPPLIDAEFEPDEDPGYAPAVSHRFRVTTAERPATADAPKRESATYYLYGQTEEQALARLPTDLRVNARVERAGRIERGVLHLPEDERRCVIVDDRVVPGTPGPAK